MRSLHLLYNVFDDAAPRKSIIASIAENGVMVPITGVRDLDASWYVSAMPPPGPGHLALTVPVAATGDDDVATLRTLARETRSHTRVRQAPLIRGRSPTTCLVSPRRASPGKADMGRLAGPLTTPRCRSPHRRL
jgi:hypothetical protein